MIKFVLKSKAGFSIKLSINSPQPPSRILNLIPIFCPVMKDRVHKKGYHVSMVPFMQSPCPAMTLASPKQHALSNPSLRPIF